MSAVYMLIGFFIVVFRYMVNGVRKGMKNQQVLINNQQVFIKNQEKLIEEIFKD